MVDGLKRKLKNIFYRVISMIDRLPKRKIIHDNKASNLKSKLTKKVNAL